MVPKRGSKRARSTKPSGERNASNGHSAGAVLGASGTSSAVPPAKKRKRTRSKKKAAQTADADVNKSRRRKSNSEVKEAPGDKKTGLVNCMLHRLTVPQPNAVVPYENEKKKRRKEHWSSR